VISLGTQKGPPVALVVRAAGGPGGARSVLRVVPWAPARTPPGARAPGRSAGPWRSLRRRTGVTS